MFPDRGNEGDRRSACARERLVKVFRECVYAVLLVLESEYGIIENRRESIGWIEQRSLLVYMYIRSLLSMLLLALEELDVEH